MQVASTLCTWGAGTAAVGPAGSQRLGAAEPVQLRHSWRGAEGPFTAGRRTGNLEVRSDLEVFQ